MWRSGCMPSGQLSPAWVVTRPNPALEQLGSILDDACSRAVFGVSLTRRCRTAMS